MAGIIAIANQKGGVGKTTTAVNLSAALGITGKKTLIIDIDPQGNASSGYGINKREISGSVYEVLIGTMNISRVLNHTEIENVDIIPSHMNLAGAEIEIIQMEDREARLKSALDEIKDSYDYILIDCPPSLGLLTLNALCAADTVLIPTQCEYYALEGMSQLINTIKRVRKSYNPNLEIEGVLFTMYDGRLNLTLQVASEIKKYFPDKVYGTVIPRNVRLSEAPSFGQPVFAYDRTSKGSEAYINLAKEFISRR